MGRWSRSRLILCLLACSLLPLFDPAPAGGASANPFLGARWYIDPASDAMRQADAWRGSRPADAAQLDKIAGQPQADWFGDWNSNVGAAVRDRVSTVAAAGALPVLVAYNIPLRDCGDNSGGGATSADAYRRWIRTFADGIGASRAVVVLEPDALAAMGCLSDADRQARLALLRDAVGVLATQPGIAVYLDAGHSGWIGADELASRLIAAGIAGATGFSLNVSNFRLTADEIGYGRDLSARVGGKHFVIDTSRNGLGPAPDEPNAWCNPPDRGLGERPTPSTADPLVDAYLWIKRPGQSDGPCNGGPAAGQWWAEYALDLARRAALDNTPTACFPQTGQCVRGRFLAYWQTHGGLAINGYPISDQLTERLEDGQEHTVQYFERVRLEYHPENAPPHDLALGQFGRLLRPDDPPVEPRAGQSYFPQTGHNLGGRFRAYWGANGGLAQFGYPISEEFEELLEDGQVHLVQYFERARFEYHPENRPPDDVLLGQFGRHILERR